MDWKEKIIELTQWRAFVRKSKPENMPKDFDTVIGEAAAFLMPVMEAAQGDRILEAVWAQSGPWG